MTSRRVLVIVQNLPVPLDRRVWLECRSLVDAGYGVSVICPKGTGDPSFEEIDGVRIYKYRPPPVAQGALGFVVEFAYAWIVTALLSIRVARRDGFDAIQACNPPDTFFLLALVHRLVRGTRFVFDQHDLCPELYESRFPGSRGPALRGLRLLERATYRVADHVIVTNESYRAVALDRGRRDADDVTVVRTGPDPERLRRRAPRPELRREHRHLVCYLGVMGPQDGVDLALEAAREVVSVHGRDDVAFTFIGSGDCYDELTARATALGLDDHVHFTGRAPDELVFDLLSTADLGLSPDPFNPLNDVSTMNKTMEYMAFELPVVAFDLRETRVSAGSAAHYVRANDVSEYAAAIVALLDDPSRRATMGAAGRTRIEEQLAWEHQRDAYVGVYDRLLGGAAAA